MLSRVSILFDTIRISILNANRNGQNGGLDGSPVFFQKKADVRGKEKEMEVMYSRDSLDISLLLCQQCQAFVSI